MEEPSIEDIDLVVANDPYPKGILVSDDGIFTVPFNLLAGESARFRGRSSEGVIIATNYRLFHTEGTYFNVPLGIIDYVEIRDIFYVYIYSKDGRTFRCIFDNNECAQTWLKRIQSVSKNPEKPDDHFAFCFFLWTMEQQKGDIVSHFLYDLRHSPAYDTETEAKRMGFDQSGFWRVSKINENYELCPSYPKHLIVPSSILDSNLKVLAYFRYSKRIPAVVWRHRQNGCVIARSSQPKLGLWGIWGWRDKDDETLIQAIHDACLSDPGEELLLNGQEQESYSLKSDFESDLSLCNDQVDPVQNAQRKLLIVDARSYAAAMTNRAKGGGYESNVYYPNCEMQFMGLANIHTIRNSFASLRALCAVPDDPNWLSSLDNTKWLFHISGIIRAALIVVNAVDIERRPVLVHCSDGWDRTPQIVALAELMLDPYYRTKQGFQVLVEREWLEFGHKFADRCGNSDGTEDRNERSPVFLQWLDCVYQLLKQFECDFEFNEQYLVRLAVHSYSNLFGNFFFNTDLSRSEFRVSQRTFSVWPMLNKKRQFHNYLFINSNKVLRPSYQMRTLKFWSDVYLTDSCSEQRKVPSLGDNLEKPNLIKTKSCDNIVSGDQFPSLARHNSNPDLADNCLDDPVNCLQINEEIQSTSNPDAPKLKNLLNENLLDDLSEANDGYKRTNPLSNGMLYPFFLLKEKSPIDGSTDTLVSEIEALAKDKSTDEAIVNNLCNSFANIKPGCSVSTSTSDLPLTVENVRQAIAQNSQASDYRLPNWGQNNLQAFISNKRNSNLSNSCSYSYTTPNHSRTPSSGFPATPCDDACDLEVSRNSSVLDIDGLNVSPIAVQERVKKIILNFKSKISSLQCELSSARYEFVDLCRYFQVKGGQIVEADDAPSLAGSGCSGEHHADSRGSESSWEVFPADQVAASQA